MTKARRNVKRVLGKTARQNRAASSRAGILIYVGHLNSYLVSVPSNMPFRVYLDVDTPACPGKLFYVPIDNPNYQAYVSGLLTAYSLNEQVAITYAPGSGGYCQILEFQVYR